MAPRDRQLERREWRRPARFSDALDVTEPTPHPVFTPRRRPGPGAQRPALPPSLTRSNFRSLDPSVSTKNETTNVGRRIVNGWPSVIRKRDLIARAVVGVSARPAKAKRVARAPGVRAKAIAADRRFTFGSLFPKRIDGTYAQTVPTTRGKLKFLTPHRVLPCVQRATRREVLFAKRKAGGAGSRKRPRHRSPHGHIQC